MPPLHDQSARVTALTNFDDNLVLVAGAGSGKTSLLVSRTLCALVGKQIDPQAMLITTFTEKAAGEMSERLDDALRELADGRSRDGSDASRARTALLGAYELDDATIRRRATEIALLEPPAVDTFHAFCLRWLQEFSRAADLPPEIEIAVGLDEGMLFDDFWPEFIESELGGRRLERDVDAAWNTLLDSQSLGQLTKLARSWCLQPEIRHLAIDWSRADLIEATRSVSTPIDEDEIKHTAKHKYGAWAQTACALVGRLLALDDTSPLPPDLERELESFLEENATAPAASDYADSRLRDTLRRAARELKRTLASWLALPNPEIACALTLFLKRTGTRFATYVAERGRLSFSECLVRCEELLRGRPAIRDVLRKRYDVLLVDEFQDTDPLQYDVLFYLAQAGDLRADEAARSVPLTEGKLCIVGDPKQSIYRFRGADMRAYDGAISKILDAGGKALDLHVNFRSEPELLGFVNRAIGPQFGGARQYQAERQDLVSPKEATGRGRVRFVYVDTDTDAGDKNARFAREAREIGRLIRRLRHESPELAYRDFALLFRATTNIELYARALRQLGIPVLLEGSKRFYERREVERFVALLRLALTPWDAAAALACLRGPLGAVPDSELFRVAEASRDATRGDPVPLPTDWIKLEHEDRDLAPALSTATTTLRTIIDEIARLPAEDALEYALRASGLSAIEAAGWEGAQRIANLEALVQRVSTWVREGDHDLASAVKRLERESANQSDAEESPLADDRSDAVRLLSIHKSKGLEWEVVVVPDFRRATKPSHMSQPPFEIDRRRDTRVALVRSEIAQSPALVAHAQDEKLHEEAELQRVLYVATTRAKRELLLTWTKTAKRVRAVWDPCATALGLELEPAPDEARDLVTGVSYDIVKDTEDSSGDPILEVKSSRDASALDGLRARRRYVEAIERRAEVGAPSAKATEDVRTTTRSRRRDARHAITVGAIVHEYLHAADFANREIDRSRMHATIAAHAQASLLTSKRERDKLVDEVESTLRTMFESPLLDRIAASRIVGRELTVFWRDDAGQHWHGEIDLVLQTGDGGPESGVVVVDYKTDRVEEGHETAFVERHRDQLRYYSDGLSRAWTLPSPPRCELWLVRRGLACPVPGA